MARVTSGVMIALALIPTAALAAMAIVAGDWPLAGKAALRWIIEVAVVIAFSAIVLGWQRYYVQRRRAMM